MHKDQKHLLQHFMSSITIRREPKWMTSQPISSHKLPVQLHKR